MGTVSYTHLDVYKRQEIGRGIKCLATAGFFSRFQVSLGTGIRVGGFHVSLGGKGFLARLRLAIREMCIRDRDDVEQAFDQKELTKAIDTFLDRLSPKKRSIFISRYWYTDSISEIAVRHNMNDGAVSMTLNRIRLKLHNYLLERGFEL